MFEMVQAVRSLRWPGASNADGGNERRLLARARQGETSAFDALIALHQNPLRGFLRRRVASECVEDVFQETVLAAWGALAGFEPRVRFKTWLYRIAHHKAADWARRRARELEVDLTVPVAYEPIARAEQACLVAALLEALTSDQRAVLELYYFEGLTLAEVATVLGRNVNTVKYHFYQAHAAAARSWKETEGDER